jgi:hypothetical protein
MLECGNLLAVELSLLIETPSGEPTAKQRYARGTRKQKLIIAFLLFQVVGASIQAMDSDADFTTFENCYHINVIKTSSL